MKNIFRRIAFVTVCTIALGTQGFAQNNKNAEYKNDRKEFKSSLNDDQKAMLKANQEKRKAFHKAFKATLNADQLAIMADKSLSKVNRKNKLGATLSPSQKEMWSSNKKQAQENRKAFNNSLTAEQKKSFKEIHKHNEGAEGDHKHKFENRKS